jgi:hypothetical protein
MAEPDNTPRPSSPAAAAEETTPLLSTSATECIPQDQVDAARLAEIPHSPRNGETRPPFVQNAHSIKILSYISLVCSVVTGDISSGRGCCHPVRSIFLLSLVSGRHFSRLRCLCKKSYSLQIAVLIPVLFLFSSNSKSRFFQPADLYLSCPFLPSTSDAPDTSFPLKHTTHS